MRTTTVFNLSEDAVMDLAQAGYLFCHEPFPGYLAEEFTSISEEEFSQMLTRSLPATFGQAARRNFVELLWQAQLAQNKHTAEPEYLPANLISGLVAEARGRRF